MPALSWPASAPSRRTSGHQLREIGILLVEEIGRFLLLFVVGDERERVEVIVLAASH
jgi:hypothetical protein